MTRDELLESMIAHARSLFERGYVASSGGNLSHRLGQGFLVTATNTSFGRLEPGAFALCDADGRHLEGPPPSKEAPFHAAIYRAKPEANAVVHLHAPAALALSCLAEPTDTGNVLPVVSSYAVTGVGRVPLLEYITPGAPELADRMETVCRTVNAVLMQNHGVTSFAPTLEKAVNIAEEFETDAGVWLATLGQARVLSDEELSRSAPLYGARIEPGSQRPRLREGVSGWGR